MLDKFDTEIARHAICAIGGDLSKIERFVKPDRHGLQIPSGLGKANYQINGRHPCKIRDLRRWRTAAQDPGFR
jgi:hypothetical protein